MLLKVLWTILATHGRAWSFWNTIIPMSIIGVTWFIRISLLCYDAFMVPRIMTISALKWALAALQTITPPPPKGKTSKTLLLSNLILSRLQIWMSPSSPVNVKWLWWLESTLFHFYWLQIRCARAHYNRKCRWFTISLLTNVRLPTLYVFILWIDSYSYCPLRHLMIAYVLSSALKEVIYECLKNLLILLIRCVPPSTLPCSIFILPALAN